MISPPRESLHFGHHRLLTLDEDGGTQDAARFDEMLHLEDLSVDGPPVPPKVAATSCMGGAPWAGVPPPIFLPTRLTTTAYRIAGKGPWVPTQRFWRCSSPSDSRIPAGRGRSLPAPARREAPLAVKLQHVARTRQRPALDRS